MLGLVVVSHAQIAVGLAIQQIFIGIEILSPGAYERVAEHGIVPVATVEVIVANLHLGGGCERASGMLVNKVDERVKALALAALKQRQCHQQLSLFFQVGAQRQLLQVGQLVNGTHIVVTVIHQLAVYEVALGASVVHDGLRTY